MRPIQVEESIRSYFNEKLQEVYNAHGVNFMVHGKEVGHDLAFVQYDHDTGEISIHCGDFWNNERDLSPVIAMAHELGHYLDAQNFDGFDDYSNRLGTKEMEVRAWEIGLAICMGIGLHDFRQEILRYALDCLGTYFDGSYLPLDVEFGFKGQSPTWLTASERLYRVVGLEPETPREKLLRLRENLLSQIEA